jgi:hypothetical protein
VDILSLEENEFVETLFYSDPGNEDTRLCPNGSSEKQCKLKGWIGLTDEVVDDTYLWVTGEPFDFSRWGTNDGSAPNDPKDNQDYVEINAAGYWSITNGASTTNEGYFTEWDVVPANPHTL